ncbi:ABC transporter substrate-binding protein [Terasakiispira papahanaumokuakeensis]|uniref:ABC transporter substrate-binding protein n=1 Tax=Terasakiispira papahanaumokuakeensis TaxID=197479 RepID=A0A1E2VA44_9GAMM|nr:ABC transporter substrate-binding protein [Terasakiispira papahanaumokuakeensis]ODC03888.1 ABC transporter substrate-binding protein [Terasakiispira papahanaumokuakeensis]
MKCLKLLTTGLLSLLISISSHAQTPSDQLIIGMSMNNLLSLDPAAATGLDVVSINANLYDTLIELDVDNPAQVNPGLAESWEISDDGRTITFKIRSGVQFHSGEPLTAKDVAWSLQRVLKLNLALATTWKTYGFTADNVEQYMRATDDHTFVLELPEATDPQLVVYTLGSSPSAFILDRKTVLEHQEDGDLGHQWLTSNAAGSGAFILNRWRAKELLLMSRNDYYWREPSQLRRVIMRHMNESQSLRLMMERGDIDVAYGMSVPDIEAMRKTANVDIQAVQRGTMYYAAVSMKDPKYAKQKVREAIRSLIDYRGINKSVMQDYGVFHQRPVKLGLEATLPEPGYQLDVEKAKKLLAEAGYPNGFKTSIRVLSETPFINIATNIQSTLAQAGIDASIITGTGNQVYGAMRDRDFEIIVGRGGGGIEPHPYSSLRSLVYNPDNRDEAKLTNFQGWRTGFYSPEINQLIENALVEKDADKQLSMYRDVQRLYDEKVGAIFPISQMVNTVALRSDVQHYRVHPAATTRLREVSKQR